LGLEINRLLIESFFSVTNSKLPQF
jgi:hypothetical protein